MWKGEVLLQEKKMGWGSGLCHCGECGGVFHHGTAGWDRCRDILVSNSLLGWRNCSLNSPLTALVGKSHPEDWGSHQSSPGFESGETNPALWLLSLKPPQQYFGRNERDEPRPACSHPCPQNSSGTWWWTVPSLWGRMDFYCQHCLPWWWI